MRHRLSRALPLAASAALALTLSLAPGTASLAADGSGSAADGGSAPSVPAAVAALTHVRSLLAATSAPRADQRAARPTGPADVSGDLTLALRDLALTRSALTGDQRREADAFLARPTDGLGDPYQDGYLTPERKKCGQRFCLHWVTSGTDAPPNQAWVDRTLAEMNKVYRAEVIDLGYRGPTSDRTASNNGGDGRFDVYLKDVGSKGYYGYCAPEQLVGSGRSYYGFCVLDDDFAQSQFGAPPANSLAVTAAHEFFHAIQFNYDAAEDPWFMESTATWMEEQVADAVNDNRQYLPQSSVARPAVPLDRFDDGTGVTQYGNWTWWQYLSERLGRSVVERVWVQASQYPGEGGKSSLPAMRSVLASEGTLAKRFASYAGANTEPQHFYSEGSAWPKARLTGSTSVGSSTRSRTYATSIDHLAAHDYRVVPSSSLASSRWGLRVSIAGPAASASPYASVVVRSRSGAISQYSVPIRSGRGSVTVPFSAASIRYATVAVANASTRYVCGNGPDTASCSGTPVDDDRAFRLTVTAVVR